MSLSVDIEKVVVIPDPEVHDLQASNDTVVEFVHDDLPWLPCLVLLTMIFFGFHFSSVSSSSPYLPNQPLLHKLVNQCMKVIHPFSREILARHGRLHGLLKTCLYLQLDGAASGRTYMLSLNQTLFDQVLHK